MSLQKHSTSNVIAPLSYPKQFVLSLGVLLVLTPSLSVGAQQPQSNSALASQDAATWAVDVRLQYGGAPNVAYIGANNREAVLDVYTPRSASASSPAPTVIYLHGGGWHGGLGIRSISVLRFLPYLEMGLAVVNVDYRNGLVPAVEDSRCALRWVIRNAQKYNFDVNKLIVTGDSAGGHLALTTGMLPASAGVDGQCPGSEELKVAAVINWYGVTDVADLLEGANQRPFVTRWLTDMPNAKEVARRVSPLQYVRPGLPPILTIHGDADRTTPYNHAVRLHKALDDAKVPNQLLTIPGGDHGSFSRDESLKIYATIREFLKKRGITK
jgi:acetyl esterase/lipase